MLPHNPGIYEIKNVINGHSYIGQSYNIHERMTQHKRRLIGGIHDNLYLQKAWNKYGEKNFVFRTILLCEKNELTYYEQKVVDIYNPSYNICRQCVISHLGVKRPEKTIKKLSDAKIGEKNPMFGKHHSENARKRISEAFMGRVFSEETKKRISKALTGIKRSEETKRKVSLANIGHHLTEETKRKLSEINKGKRTGWHPTEIQRKKMSIAQKARFSKIKIEKAGQ